MLWPHYASSTQQCNIAVLYWLPVRRQAILKLSLCESVSMALPTAYLLHTCIFCRVSLWKKSNAVCVYGLHSLGVSTAAASSAEFRLLRAHRVEQSSSVLRDNSVLLNTFKKLKTCDRVSDEYNPTPTWPVT